MHIKTYKVVSAKYHNRDENKIPWVFKGGKQFHPDRGISEMVRISRISHFKDYEREIGKVEKVRIFSVKGRA